MSAENPNSRLEAFSDGVFAFALTLLIIDIRIPTRVQEAINTNADLWLALKHLIPPISAFLLSFTVVLINWVNHHNAFKLLNKTSSVFIYSNGFLLLTIVFFPFPTALIGDNILTNHAAPAVVLYCTINMLSGVGWFLATYATLNPVPLTKSDKATQAARRNLKFSIYAVVGYTILAILAFWFPKTIAIVLAALWLFWLINGITFKTE